MAFLEALGQGAELDVNLGRFSEPRADGVESLGEVGRERGFEVGGEGLAGEFVLDGDGSLFTPDGKFLCLRGGGSVY